MCSCPLLQSIWRASRISASRPFTASLIARVWTPRFALISNVPLWFPALRARKSAGVVLLQLPCTAPGEWVFRASAGPNKPALLPQGSRWLLPKTPSSSGPGGRANASFVTGLKARIGQSSGASETNLVVTILEVAIPRKQRPDRESFGRGAAHIIVSRPCSVTPALTRLLRFSLNTFIGSVVSVVHRHDSPTGAVGFAPAKTSIRRRHS